MIITLNSNHLLLYFNFFRKNIKFDIICIKNGFNDFNDNKYGSIIGELQLCNLWMASYKIDISHLFYTIKKNEMNINNFINISNILTKNFIQILFNLKIKRNNKEIRNFIIFNNINYKNKQEIKKLFILNDNAKDKNNKNIFHKILKFNRLKTFNF